MKGRSLRIGYALAIVEAKSKQMGGRIMNKSIITVACALIAPVAFAQTSTTTTEQTTTAAPATTTTTESTTYEAGTVTTYTPGKTIRSEERRVGKEEKPQ